MSAQFVVKRAVGDGAVFAYQDAGRRAILTSRRYETIGAAQGGIESVRDNAASDERYERLMARSGHPYFNLKAADGRIIGTSVMFASPQERHAAIKEMQRDATTAPIVTPAARD